MQINPAALRAIRESQGLSIQALADQSGIHASTVSRLESGGRKGNPAQARKLAEALRVPLPAITVRVAHDEAVA